MHVYIYDDFLNSKRYDSVLARIEMRITDLGLSGRIIRLGTTRNIAEAVANELIRGAKTIVAVGDNGTINRVLNAMMSITPARLPAGAVPLAIIPVDKKDGEIASFLGLNSPEAACDTLASRRIEMIDLGQANNFYFLAEAMINAVGTKLEIDQNYSIETSGGGSVSIVNMPAFGTSLPARANSSPQDGALELCVAAKTSGRLIKRTNGPPDRSIFYFQHLQVINQSQPLLLDGAIELPTPAAITLASRKLPIIVGKERKF